MKDIFFCSFQDGNIPLFAAIKAGNWAITQELLRHETKAQITYTNEPLRNSALHLAAREEDNDMMKLLIQLGAEVDLQNVKIYL